MTIKPYQIYHLQNELLDKLERSSDRTKNEDLAVAAYIRLTSNQPRIDRTIKKSFGFNPLTVDEIVNDKVNTPEKINDEKRLRKVEATTELMSLGYYEKVAEVDAETAREAVHLTSNINQYWCLSANNKIDCVVDCFVNGFLRTTTSYDVIDRFGKRFLYMPLGIIDLQSSEYSDELV